MCKIMQIFRIFSVALWMLSLSLRTSVSAQDYDYTEDIDDDTAYKKLFYAGRQADAIADGFIVVLNKTKLYEIWNDPKLTDIVSNFTTNGKSLLVQKVNSEVFMVNLKVDLWNYTDTGNWNETVQERRRRLLPWLKNGLVQYMEQDQRFNKTSDQQFPTWGLDRIDQGVLPLNNQYHYDNTGKGVTAYIVDTGLLSTHTDFNGRASCDMSFIPDEDCEDGNGHGTHVSGTIGSSTYGVAKEVKLVGVKVLDNEGGGANSGVINGIDYVLQQVLNDPNNGPAVCNLSLGGGFSRALNSAVIELVKKGNVFTAVAAGNEDMDACGSSPAAAARNSDIVSVGATDESDQRASFSNFGDCVTLFAPGMNIESTWFTSNVAINTISGTSMASPHVAGVGALYLEDHPDALPSEVKEIIMSGATENVVSDVNGSPNVLLNTEVLFESTPQSPPSSQAPVTFLRIGMAVSTILLSLLL